MLRAKALPTKPAERAIVHASASILLTLFAVMCAHGPARAQFGPDLRLTFAPWGSTTCLNNGWSIAVDAQRNIHTIYSDNRAFDPDGPYPWDDPPYYQRYDLATGTWLPEVRLPDHPLAVSSSNAAIVADWRGYLHTAWSEFYVGDPSIGSIYYKGADSTFTWFPEFLVAQGIGAGPPYPGSPSLAADKNGNVIVVWMDGTNAYCRFRNARTGYWGPSRALTAYPPTYQVYAPTVAFQNCYGDTTVAHIAWRDELFGDPIPDGIGYAAIGYTEDGTELPLGQTVIRTAGLGYPSIATWCKRIDIVQSAEPYAAIVHLIGMTPEDGVGMAVFAAPEFSGYYGSNPSLAIDGKGDAHVVIETPDGGGIVDARWSVATETWEAFPVSDPLAIFPLAPSVAVDASGEIHVLWNDLDAPSSYNTEVYYDAGWLPTTPDPPPPSPPTSAKLTYDLRAVRAGAGPGDRISVILRMRESPDPAALRQSVSGLPKLEKQRRIMAELRDLAAHSQSGLLSDLALAGSDQVKNVRPLMLINAVAAEVSPALLDQLVRRQDLRSISYNPTLHLLDRNGASRVDTKPSDAASDGDHSADNSAESHSEVDGTQNVIRAETLVNPPTEVAWGVDWVGAPQVWDQGYRGDCVLVGILDTGIDLQHSDLVDRLWRNADEDPDNGIDDDGNGYIDDYNGFDIGSSVDANGDGDFNDPGDVNDPIPMDVNGHGTHVSGTIAGDGTGGTITGVAPQATLMMVKVFSNTGSTTNAKLLEGMYYALANGAQVLNMSLGGYCLPQAVRDDYRVAGNLAYAMGVTICKSAGNDGDRRLPPGAISIPGDVPPPWISPDQPVLGTRSGVTTVGATRYRLDAVTPWSGRGPVDWSASVNFFRDWDLADPATPGVGLIKPDVCAPGNRIKSCRLGGGYVGEDPADPWDGTSMATPHVTGLVALLLSKDPELESDEIERILEQSAVQLLGPPFKNNRSGAGRVRAPEAIALAPNPSGQALYLFDQRFDDTTGGDGDGILEAGESADGIVQVLNNGPYLVGDVIGILSASDPYVSVTDDLSAFGDIPSGDIRDNETNPFRVTVDSGAPEGHVVDFLLQVMGDGACAIFTFQHTLGTGGGGGGTMGACCSRDGSCQLVTASGCVEACGDFQGLGTACSPNPCAGFIVMNSNPAPGEMDVAWRPVIRVDFNRAVNATDLTAQKFHVRGTISGPAPGTITVAPDHLSATFETYSGSPRMFSSGELVESGIAGSLVSEQGDALIAPWVWHFRAFAQRGDGTFSGPTTLSPNSSVVAVAAGDLNQNGRTDLAACGTDGKLIVYLNTTPPWGSLSYQTFPFTIGSSLSSLVLQDLDNDGDLDIAAADQNADLIRIGRNGGDGSTYTWTTWPAGDGPQRLGTGDMDGDGNPDLAFVNESSNDLYIHLGDGTGGVRATGIYPLANNPVDLMMRDLDNDGLLDLVVLHGSAAQITVLRNVDPKGAAGTMFNITTTASVNAPWGLLVEDLTGDGRPDVAVATADGARVAVYPMQTCAVPASPSLYATGSCPPQNALRGLAPLDFDGDGDLDLAVTNSDCGRWILLENDGAGGFTVRGEFATQARPILPLAADLNNDGLMDVAVPERVARRIEIWLGGRLSADAGEPGAAGSLTPGEILSRPNPFRDDVEFALPGTGAGRLEVFDAAGRIVRQFVFGSDGSATRRVVWDGRDAMGHAVASGLYLVRLIREGRPISTRVLRLQ